MCAHFLNWSCFSEDSLLVTVPSSPQGETVVELVDEDHSLDFEELKKVAETAQGVGAH